MVCGSEGEVIRSRIDPCRKCGKRVIVNSVLCTKCDQWIQGKCFKLKKVAPSAARLLVCSNREKVINGARKVQQEVICDDVETAKGFFYLGNRLNASGGCEAPVTTRTILVRKKFRECGEILFGKILFAVNVNFKSLL